MRYISDEQVIGRIRAENPWWDTKAIGEEYRRYEPRAYFQLFYPLVEATRIRRAVVLMGPRRVGKTVMIHHAIQALLESGVDARSICYLSVDHPMYNGRGLDELIGFYEEASGCADLPGNRFVFFDEIQYLRDWEIHLKTVVDDRPRLKAIASGSAAAALRLQSIESGAGRFTDFFLPPLTFHEYLALTGDADLINVDAVDPRTGFFRTDDVNFLNGHFLDYLNFGGYPEVATSREIQADPGRFIKGDIIDKVLLRDLPSLYGIGDIQELNYLFTTLAFNTANEVSLRELSLNSGVAKNTLKKYVEYLEAAFLVKLVHRVDRSAKRFQRASFFKIYLTNPSMRAALFSPVGENDETMGALAETAIFSQWFHATDFDLYYARWREGEVDIVGFGPEQKAKWVVEVKWSDRYHKRPDRLKALIRFSQENAPENVTVTTRTGSGVATEQGIKITFVPASIYCFTVGYNIVHRRRMG